jgi:Flp pilus assembly protein TadD
VAALWLEARQPADALDAASGAGDDPRLVFLRGLALQQLRRWSEAASAFAEVPSSAGELYASARAALGYALGRAGRPAEAVRAVKRGLAAQPQDPTLLYALGEAYDRAGQREAALAEMRRVLEVKADHAEALNFLGYAYAERGERLEEAQGYVERALKVEPDNGYFLDSLGWVLFKRGDLPRAVTTLERADRLAGPEPTILDHLGDAYRRAQRPADAARAWKRALAAPDPAGDDERAMATRRAAMERKLREIGPAEARAAHTRR